MVLAISIPNFFINKISQGKNSVREKIPTANLAFLSFNFRISSCSFPTLNSFSRKNSVYLVKIEILRQLFQLVTIARLRKE